MSCAGKPPSESKCRPFISPPNQCGRTPEPGEPRPGRVLPPALGSASLERRSLPSRPRSSSGGPVMAHSCPALRPRFLSALLVGTLVAAAGCDSGPKVYPVKGKIVNKGRGHVKDLAGYSVQFQSVNDPAETPGGPIEEDGSFTL